MSNEKQTVIKLLDFTLLNAEKYNRAINGAVVGHGKLVGGVGEDASDLEKLAEYDRLGGAIRKGKSVVKTGSFYDFKARKPRTEPEVVLQFRDLEGQLVELAADEEVPIELKAAQIAEEKRVAKAVEKAAKKAGKKAKEEVEESDEE